MPHLLQDVDLRLGRALLAKLIIGLHFFEAVPVQLVATFGREDFTGERFKMPTAVAARVELKVSPVVMVSALRLAHTSVARKAMKEVLFASGLAHAAVVAVELVLARVVVVECALGAEVLSKLYLAVDAVALWRLDGQALRALDHLHVLLVELVR